MKDYSAFGDMMAQAWRDEMWADLRRRYAAGEIKIHSRAPSRLADFHELDASAQRVILEIEVGL